MAQVCNLVYFTLIDGKTEAQRAEIDVMLTDPSEKEMMIARQNEIAMQELQKSYGIGMIQPLVNPQRHLRAVPNEDGRTS